MIAHHLEHITVQRLRVAEHACMRQVNATGPGYVTYKLAPAQPLATGHLHSGRQVYPNRQLCLGLIIQPLCLHSQPCSHPAAANE